MVEIRNENDESVYRNIFSPYPKTVFIKMDAYALGDSIAWIPYVEAFRKKHNCKVICSTFHNNLFVDAYPQILFVKPNTVVENVYAQYYIGASNDDNPYYSPIKVNEHPLQMVASSILGLEHEEMRPDLTLKYEHLRSYWKERHIKYVTLSEFGSSPNKHWKAENGWQWVVDYLQAKGYTVVVISKEKTSLVNCVDKSGDYSLDDRAVDIKGAEFHLGVSSGLSWLAWALGKHTVMISDVTPNWHEFTSDITRINANDLTSVNYLAEGQSSLDKVLKTLAELIVS
jgi:autotransporter strand-loop-strand O-heptosyltransferase